MDNLFPIIRRKRRSLLPAVKPPIPVPPGEAPVKQEADRMTATKGTNVASADKQDDDSVINKQVAQ
jgi:hypothetical protein